jgi:2-oxoglutarate dehydrogenase E2 component (dihydrolipoamide succinyltransferase)
MASFEIVMPKMGESIIEATITRWMKQPGDSIEEDEPIAEIATDKVDSEIPSPVEGTIKEVYFKEGDVVPVGKIIALIDLGGDGEEEKGSSGEEEKGSKGEVAEGHPESPSKGDEGTDSNASKPQPVPDNTYQGSEKFYSPLVKNIAKEENISPKELDSIQGSGKDGRVTKKDILAYLENRPAVAQVETAVPAAKATAAAPKYDAPTVVADSGDEVFEMDRMRKLIADHMVMSKQVSPHVTSLIDVDVTNIVLWREKIKIEFQKREGEKITYTPIIMEATAQALKEYPRVNASVDGYNIIHRKNINIGMATALPNGNLIVPVIQKADQKSLLGLTRDVNDLANRARNNNLLPDEIQGGTFTVTNFGTFDSLTGTPIINQPQVAILGIGAIRKKPVVVETPQGDVIAIRHIMILSLAYDHRIVDGALGGMFIRRMKEILENWDVNRTV